MQPTDENKLPDSEQTEVSMTPSVEEPTPTPEPEEAPPEDTTVYHANAVEELPCKEPLTEKQLADFSIYNSLSVLYSTPRAVLSSIHNTGDKEMADPASAMEWMQASTRSDDIAPVPDDHANQEAWREGAEWRQYIEQDGQRFRTQRPKLGEATGRILSGTAAIRRVQARLSMGAHMRQPMWNSGFWLTIVPPQEATLLNLDRKLQMEKIRLGRESRGAIFDNYRVYVIAELVNTILEHVDDTSIQIDGGNMVDIIKANLAVTDIPALALAFACTIYPDGYGLSQPCTADVSKCQHVAKELIALTKLLWVDRTRLTESQRRLMARKASHKVTVKEIQDYQTTFPSVVSGVIDLPGDMRLRLKVPSFAEYEDSGTRWVQSIEDDLDRVFGTKLVGEDRDRFMFEQANAQVIRNYSHWFAELILDVGEDSEQVISDRYTLEETAQALSPDERIVDAIEMGVRKYTSEIPVTVIGLVNYACPKCGQFQLRPDTPNKVIIPLDAVSTFFTLQYNRLTSPRRH